MSCEEITIDVVQEAITVDLAEETISVELADVETVSVDTVDETFECDIVEETISFEINPAIIQVVGGIFNWIYETYTLTALQISTKSIYLGNTPYDLDSVQLWVEGGATLVYGEHYIVTGSTLSWDSLDIDGILAEGDVVGVRYVIR